MWKKLRRLRYYMLAVSVPLIAVPVMLTALVGTSDFSALEKFQNILFDQYQRWYPRPFNPDSPVRVIAIDAESIKRLGQWPWPRSLWADIIQRLVNANVAAVGIDVQFSEADHSSFETLIKDLPPSPARDAIVAEIANRPSNDSMFADALKDRPIVLGMLMTNIGKVDVPVKSGFAYAGDDARMFADQYSGGDLPLPVLLDQAAGIAAQNWLPDRDNTVRRVPLVVANGDKLMPALSVETLRVALGASTIIIKASNASGEETFGKPTGINAIKIGDAVVSTQSHGEITVHYSATDARRTVPVWKLFDTDADLSDLEGKIVFVGASDPLLHDNPPTPISPAMPGVEVHAQVVEQVLSGETLVRPDWANGMEAVVALLFCLAFMFLLPNVGALWCALAGGGVAIAMAAGSWYAFTQLGLLIDPIFPSLWPGVVFLVGILTLYGMKRRQESEMRMMFGQFVSPTVVARLAEHPENLKLGGDQRVMTLMFCDIRSFTTISEGKTAQELTRFLNEYLTPLTDVVLDHLGTVDKYMGDAIMAFWNAPLDDKDHAANAADAALDMRRKLAILNEGWRKEASALNRPYHPVRFGVGLNTGEACVGNIGSTRRLNYSVIGDEVNIASRLEGASKYFGVDIVCSAATVELAPELAWLEIDRVLLKGKTKPVAVYALAGDRIYAKSPEFNELNRLHAAMLAAYREQNLARAQEKAILAQGMAPAEVRGLYKFHGARFTELATHASGGPWDPMVTLDEK